MRAGDEGSMGFCCVFRACAAREHARANDSNGSVVYSGARCHLKILCAQETERNRRYAPFGSTKLHMRAARQEEAGLLVLLADDAEALLALAADAVAQEALFLLVDPIAGRQSGSSF